MPDSPSAWLRSLAAEATPGPWFVDDYGSAEEPFGWVSPHGAYSSQCPADNRLIALAPDLAVLCADAIDTLEATRDFLPPVLHDSTADPFHPGNMVASLLARFAALQPDNTKEGT